MAALLWPCLSYGAAWPGVAEAVSPAAPARAGPGRAAFLINPGSVRNSLLLFNLLFLVQTVMDLGILTGGVGLPQGMSYAAYAHRGAYPLVATALLAGLFTLITRPMTGNDRQLRGLVYLWLGQNMLLVATAAVRLHLYVQAYALTYLRVAAFIWMALVLAGLVLMVLQLHRGHGNRWLLRRCFAALAAALYICCFINFANLIAGYNLSQDTPLQRRDSVYICRLGPAAHPAIHAHEARTGRPLCGRPLRYTPGRTEITDWREWGFRRWRIQAYYRPQS
jgi:hypothetical protein